MNPIPTTRVDLHCHSSASAVSKLGMQRSLGLPECATPPEEVYELAKRRGMDFVTITDHDTIDGCLELAGRDDIFISEELTAWFWDEPQAVHLLCLGITPDDHARLHERSRDLESCAEYLYSHEIACSLAHPFYAVEAPLTPAHRRRLAQLFPVWRPATAPARASSTCRLRSTSRRTVDRHRRLGRPCRRGHRADVHRGTARRHAGRVSASHSRGPCRGARRAGQRRQVGPLGDGAGHPRAPLKEGTPTMTTGSDPGGEA